MCFIVQSTMYCICNELHIIALAFVDLNLFYVTTFCEYLHYWGKKHVVRTSEAKAEDFLIVVYNKKFHLSTEN